MTEDDLVAAVIADVEDGRRRVEVEDIRVVVKARHGRDLGRDTIVGALRRLGYRPTAVGDELWAYGRHEKPLTRRTRR